MAKKNIKTKTVKDENVKNELIETEKKEETKVFSDEECEQILNEKIETDIPLIDIVEFEKDIDIKDIKLDETTKNENKVQPKNKRTFEQMFGYFWNGQV